MPIPRSVICSPSHMMNIVPIISIKKIVISRKNCQSRVRDGGRREQDLLLEPQRDARRLDEGQEDRAVGPGHHRCAKRLRAMSPDFETPIFYFKPYPGSAIVLEAVGKGFRLPDSLGEWAQFDYVAGEPGPWVNRAKFKLIERFKFFQELAWKRALGGS